MKEYNKQLNKINICSMEKNRKQRNLGLHKWLIYNQWRSEGDGMAFAAGLSKLI